MKTIDKRADDYAFNNWFGDQSAFKGYIQGAKDQQAIDIEKACEAYCKSQCNRITSDCRLCRYYKAFRNYLLNNEI